MAFTRGSGYAYATAATLFRVEGPFNCNRLLSRI
jgi:hypothetical protein